MTWQPIETMPRDDDNCAPFDVVVAWRVDMPRVGAWWEYSTDELTVSATHWLRLPAPPEVT